MPCTFSPPFSLQLVNILFHLQDLRMFPPAHNCDIHNSAPINPIPATDFFLVRVYPQIGSKWRLFWLVIIICFRTTRLNISTVIHLPHHLPGCSSLVGVLHRAAPYSGSPVDGYCEVDRFPTSWYKYHGAVTGGASEIQCKLPLY